MPNETPKPDIDVSDLEKKVDQMMDLSDKDAAIKQPIKVDAQPASDIDIFQQPATAPEVPKALAQYVDALSDDMPDISPEADAQAKTIEPAKPAPDYQQPSSTTTNDVIESPVTDEAVTDIVRNESDALLAIHDEPTIELVAKKPAGLKQKIGHFFRAWWQNKKARYATIAVLLLIIAGLVAWPTSRYAVLNTAGVRSGATVKIIDEGTKLPLKNVRVSIGTIETKTNENGVASFRLIKLGKQKFVVDRVAFAQINKEITIGWGSNPLGSMELEATGARYEFMIKDYLSGKPIKAEAVSDEASAFSDKSGKIILTIDAINKETVDITIKSEGYRDEKIIFAANKKDATEVVMVAAQPIVYVTKQSGRYDVYKIDVDGKNKTLLLAGTGRERQAITTSVSPSGDEAVVVSSRGTTRDKGGYLLDTLTRIDLKTNEAKTIDEAQNIRLIDWSKQRLVYVATYAAPSAATGDRQRVVAYDVSESARTVLASSDYFNGIVSADGYIYYAIASSDPKQAASFQKIHADGSAKQTLLNKQVYSVARTTYDKLSLETPDGWYDYTLGAGTAAKGDAPTDTYVSRQYFVSYDGSHSLWVDSRDGKGVLVLTDQKTSKETVLVATGGLTAPVRWLSNNTVLYRVVNASETADYVISITGGEAKKIGNVTNTAGLGSTL